jgi:hypothetical protein
MRIMSTIIDYSRGPRPMMHNNVGASCTRPSVPVPLPDFSPVFRLPTPSTKAGMEAARHFARHYPHIPMQVLIASITAMLCGEERSRPLSSKNNKFTDSKNDCLPRSWPRCVNQPSSPISSLQSYHDVPALSHSKALLEKDWPREAHEKERRRDGGREGEREEREERKEVRHLSISTTPTLGLAEEQACPQEFPTSRCADPSSSKPSPCHSRSWRGTRN